MSESLWIFGYGSLVWRPAFAHSEKRPAYVRGWSRRFWQGSTDHRGVPGSPGRVVTLVRSADPGAVCWGMAYRVEAVAIDGVLARLDHREKGGYERFDVELSFAAAPVPRERGLMYVAGASNVEYLGQAPIPAIARQVSASNGPSGSNIEYVLQLAQALRDMGAGDDHVFEVEAALSDELG